MPGTNFQYWVVQYHEGTGGVSMSSVVSERSLSRGNTPRTDYCESITSPYKIKLSLINNVYKYCVFIYLYHGKNIFDLLCSCAIFIFVF